MALRYICLSDLHLGAADSLLTHIDGMDQSSPALPSQSLVLFAEALRATAKRLSDGTLPTLVLLGDVMDLGLSPAGVTAKAFLRFLDVLFPEDGERLFQPDIVCVPGNHDYSIWSQAQETAFMASVECDGAETVADDLAQFTPMFGAPQLVSPLMTRLLQTRKGLEQASVRIAYPNLGLQDAGGKRIAVIHHGHNIDAMYRALSRFKSFLSDTPDPPMTVAELAENGPWIDFLWSDLGSAGDAGKGAGALYEIMLDAGASHYLAGEIADRLLDKLEKGFGLLPNKILARGVTVSELVRGLIDLTIGKAAESQRNGYSTVLATDELADLRWYLSGPVATQMRDERINEVPDQIAFIFGHTHKPFQDQLSVPGFTLPVAIYNTGGWVLDQPTLMPCQGASAILLDDALDIAALRLFNDPVNGVMAGVHVEGIGGWLDQQNPFLLAVTVAVASEAERWDLFSDAVKHAIDKRAKMRMAELYTWQDAAE